MSDYAQEYYTTGKLSTTEGLIKQFRDRIDRLIEKNKLNLKEDI